MRNDVAHQVESDYHLQFIEERMNLAAHREHQCHGFGLTNFYCADRLCEDIQAALKTERPVHTPVISMVHM